MPSHDETRRRVELAMKLDAVQLELGEWLRATLPGAELEKHHSQVRRVADQLGPLVQRVRAEAAADDIGCRWRTVEQQTLDLHRAWDFFREKLSLRMVPWLRACLLTADEYAWACYEPAQRAAVRSGGVPQEAVREPPLVAFSSSASPFSIARGRSLAGETGSPAGGSAAALVAALPIPVIGVPWYQLRHLPDTLIIGHEVGHLVFHDAGLASTAQSLVTDALDAGAGSSSTSCWRGWLDEVVADVYGALAGGPGYSLALGDFLLVSGVDPGTDGGAVYPPSALRLALTLAALREAGCQVDDLSSRFDMVLGSLSEPEVGEADRIAAALVHGEFPSLGAPLAAILDPRIPAAARREADSLLEGWAPQTNDIRTLVATAAYAFSERPTCYRRLDLTTRLLARARQIQQPGVRFRGGGEERDDHAVRAADSAATDALYDILSGPGSMPDETGLPE